MIGLIICKKATKLARTSPIRPYISTEATLATCSAGEDLRSSEGLGPEAKQWVAQAEASSESRSEKDAVGRQAAVVLRLLPKASGAEAVEAVVLHCGAAWCRTAASAPGSASAIPAQQGAVLQTVDAVAHQDSLLTGLRYSTPTSTLSPLLLAFRAMLPTTLECWLLILVGLTGSANPLPKQFAHLTHFSVVTCQ